MKKLYLIEVEHTIITEEEAHKETKHFTVMAVNQARALDEASRLYKGTIKRVSEVRRYDR